MALKLLEIVGIANGVVTFVFFTILVCAYWEETWLRREHSKRS